MSISNATTTQVDFSTLLGAEYSDDELRWFLPFANDIASFRAKSAQGMPLEAFSRISLSTTNTCTIVPSDITARIGWKTGIVTDREDRTMPMLEYGRKLADVVSTLRQGLVDHPFLQEIAILGWGETMRREGIDVNVVGSAYEESTADLSNGVESGLEEMVEVTSLAEVRLGAPALVKVAKCFVPRDIFG